MGSDRLWSYDLTPVLLCIFFYSSCTIIIIINYSCETKLSSGLRHLKYMPLILTWWENPLFIACPRHLITYNEVHPSVFYTNPPHPPTQKNFIFLTIPHYQASGRIFSWRILDNQGVGKSLEWCYLMDCSWKGCEGRPESYLWNAIFIFKNTNFLNNFG